MDWPGSAAMFGNYQRPAGDEEEGNEEEDFYGYGSSANGVNGRDTAAGALPEALSANGTGNRAHGSNVNQIHGKFDIGGGYPAGTFTPTAEQKRLENQRKADDLRAKLIAQRQNTPGKALSRANTPIKNAGTMQQPKVEIDKSDNEQQTEPSSDIFGLEALLAEGRAAAEANIKEQATAPPAAASTAVTLAAPEHNMSAINGQAPQGVHPTTEPAENTESAPAENTEPAPTNKPAESKPELPKWSTKLTDAYYADLSIWLEVTGYHDVEYRNSKLHTYKERKALEQEAARIAERLEKLRQAEQANIESLRATPAHATPAASVHRPALPAVMPSADAATAFQTTPTVVNKPSAPAANGNKRAHSPEPVHSSKARRDEQQTGFRIRGANYSPTAITTRRHARSPSPVAANGGGGLERRISYPDARRRSLNGYGGARGVNNRIENDSRDPSLERRQNYYGRGPNGIPFTPADRDRYGPKYAGRELEENENRGRQPWGSGPPPGRGEEKYGDQPQQYRGSAGLALKRGGVRYFMIKSWNHDNVVNAMRDGVWATQEKNEQMLTDAFKTCRHVVLLFSVNKSMAFQGYALMTSAPDPSIPKPPFCAKLNWGTSPAFTLRWLGTTPIHFRHVGHLKNEFNHGEDGKAMAVLVGKDGQEVSAEAGMGLVWILDEVEEVEAGKVNGKAGRGWG